MTLDQKFQRDRRDHPSDLLIGIVVSILLHSILYFGYDYWRRAFKPEHKQSSEPIPIEFVEVPPNSKQTPPPQTKRRAANDSVAGGRKSEKPVAALVPPVVREQGEQGSRGAEEQRGRGAEGQRGRSSLIAKLKPQTSALAKLNEVIAPIPQPQPKKQTSAIAPNIPQPKRLTRQDLLPPSASSQATRNTRTIEPKARTSALAKREGVIAPIPQPQPKPRREQRSPLGASSQLATRITPKIQSQKPSRSTGAASRLGGSMSVSSRNFKGNYQAALPNSNRSNRGTQGIDARRDVDMGSYLMQLQQRVRQQWIPGLTQSSRQTVVYFAVSRSGQVNGLRVVQPSGSSVTDSAALGAVSRAAPFAPLPTGYPRNSINIQFTFNINVSGHLDLRVR